MIDDISQTAPIGVVIHTKGDGTEKIIADFATALKGRMVTVGGLVQIVTPTAHGKPRIDLQDVRLGTIYPISVDLGPGSQSCSLDTQGLAEASQVIRREVEAEPDLLIFNKFGVTEAEGKGLLQELYQAIDKGLPILIAVSTAHETAWDTVMGGVGTKLKADPDALSHWWEAISHR